MRPISEDLRKRIIAARERGESAQDIARRFTISKRSVERYWSRYQQSGSYASYQKGKPAGSKLDKHKQALRQWIDSDPSLTLEQVCERLQKERAVSISIPGLWRLLSKYGLSFKKNDMRKRAES